MDPKKLILIDGVGALVSAFLLGVVLTRFESMFGMPQDALYILALLPCFFALYDFICYFRVTQNWSTYLKIIAVANLVYCCISIGFLIHHYEKLTNLGLLYFFLEFIIIIVLVIIEFRTATQLERSTDPI